MLLFSARLLADYYCPLGDFVAVAEVESIINSYRRSICHYCACRCIEGSPDGHSMTCEYADVMYF